MSVITDMRNPALKPRHWKQIEKIIDHTFEPEQAKNLQLLADLKAFEFQEEIQEVSGQASSEASLEGILKKVRLNNGRLTVTTNNNNYDIVRGNFF